MIKPGRLTVSWPLVSVIVPVSARLERDGVDRRPRRWRLAMACRSEPGPASLRLVTVKCREERPRTGR